MSEFNIPGVVVIDDFLPDFERVREHAKLSHYYDWVGPDNEVYKRITLLHVPGMFDKLCESLGLVKISMMGYRLNYEGELPNAPIHSDLGYATHACVVYLNEGYSGTAFWKHKATGADSIEFGQAETMEQIVGDFENPEAWDQRMVVPTRQNRAVIYRGNLFHSRYPFEAFGSTPDDGRLIAVAFFSFEDQE